MNIRDLALPRVQFTDGAALRAYRHIRERYECAVADYAAGGDDIALWDALTAIGYDNVEVQFHVDRPGWRMPEGVLS